MKQFLVLFALLGLVRAQETAKPNIIWIMADDLGYGELGYYGQQVIQTPNIDRMALGGLRFTHLYSGATVCVPSRSVLMTGQNQGRWKGIRRNPGKPIVLFDQQNDIAEKTDVAAEHADIVEKIDTYLNTVRSESADWPVK